MDLLTAVNLVLPYLAEHKVTSTDSRNPVVDLILDALDRNRITLLAEGTYLNTVEKLTLYPNSDKKIVAPTEVLALYGLDYPVRLEGAYIYNIKDDTYLFNKSLNVRLIRNIEFEDLPYYAASYITYKSAYEVYTASFGIDNTATALVGLSEEARRKFTQEDLRNRDYNSLRSNLGSLSFRLLRR